MKVKQLCTNRRKRAMQSPHPELLLAVLTSFPATIRGYCAPFFGTGCPFAEPSPPLKDTMARKSQQPADMNFRSLWSILNLPPPPQHRKMDTKSKYL